MSHPTPERYLVPRRLDDPPQFFMWDADEAVLVIAAAILFSVAGNGLGFLAGAALGLFAARGLATLKLQGGLGTIKAFLWWYTWSDPWWQPKARRGRLWRAIGAERALASQASNAHRELIG